MGNINWLVPIATGFIILSIWLNHENFQKLLNYLNSQQQVKKSIICFLILISPILPYWFACSLWKFIVQGDNAKYVQTATGVLTPIVVSISALVAVLTYRYSLKKADLERINRDNERCRNQISEGLENIRLELGKDNLDILSLDSVTSILYKIYILKRDYPAMNEDYILSLQEDNLRTFFAGKISSSSLSYLIGEQNDKITIVEKKHLEKRSQGPFGVLDLRRPGLTFHSELLETLKEEDEKLLSRGEVSSLISFKSSGLNLEHLFTILAFLSNGSPDTYVSPEILYKNMKLNGRFKYHRSYFPKITACLWFLWYKYDDGKLFMLRGI
ncbi:hypothetical protein [Mastigocoleus sp. MO_188.B34]|uniref:hypothetical protein n=1 Tax=Mastigocoleus sp. MO_188.B34 TaxID=3036635 RepID=UPI002627AEE4|nr:hypothetical protein [Mastigocoleus sp. MO_188.B34]MDJ0696812.1 hypothetical protein [Mastigocoleus sp. MO_188.B34]